MKTDKQFLLRLRKKIEKDWGKECKEFETLCCVCQIWRAYEVIESLYKDKEMIFFDREKNK